MTMAMLHLDYQQDRPLHWAGQVLLALALAALALTVAYYLELSERAAGWEAKLEQAELRQGLRPSAGNSGGNSGGISVGRGQAGLALEVGRANEVVRQLTLPWEQLFHAVESAGSKHIALLALEPDTEKKLVKINGEAKNLAVLLNYISSLERQEVFGPVFLQSHQVQQGSERSVRFTLLAVWRGTP